ncbi:MAG: ribose-phosphate pyrophosphokinase [Pseudomonadota bacterium]
MKPVVIAMPGNESLSGTLAAGLDARLGRATVRRFPDGESYVRIDAPVRGRDVMLVCTMDRPDEKFLSLAFLAATARDLGAERVGLVSPYLPYMRQDKRFRKGEAVTSAYFGDAMSRCFDWVVTVDPHLHRRHGFSEIYRIPVVVAHAAPLISAWIRRHVSSPVVVGPDHESAQWVSAVAKDAGATHLVLEKRRSGDHEVEISRLRRADRKRGTPVVVDDIISTGRTMAETVRRLREAGYPRPYCVGIHGIFADDAYRELKEAGVRKVVTCNAVPHPSNAIDITPLLIDAIGQVDMLFRTTPGRRRIARQPRRDG